MASTLRIKIGLLAAFSLLLLAWAVSATYSAKSEEYAGDVSIEMAATRAVGSPDDYVGSESCKACHEDQFKSFSHTKHSKLSEIGSWKGKVQGCESCHGPGKAHMEDATDLTKIISFKGKNSKQISETCLACHAGKESHNNFRRGEHWRNDVGCTDCHTTHGTPLKNAMADSISLVADVNIQKPGVATDAMLKSNEPQLCMSCHTETKSQFSKPFHHRVLEGTMKCSDCHNPHGGFEVKQAKLAIGLDAACVKCHTNKQGPFVYEHAPLKIEGCSICHTPHGASNAKMLKRPQVRQLCLECHTGITEEISPQAPSLHNQAQVRYQNCTVCHSAIHGSNSSRFFFR